MSESDRTDPLARPDDPAGTKPKVDTEALVPAIREPLLPVDEPLVVDDNPLLPEKLDAAGLGPALGASDTQHTPRFQFLLGALFALGLAGVAAAIALAVQGTPEKAPEMVWSSWRPSSSNPAAEIADHVGKEYRQEGGEQLVLVKGGPLAAGDVPLQIVLNQDGDYTAVGGTGVLYQLCGLGQKCRIPTGKPSAERGTLLRREILELALYTFRYTDADNVVGIMPPGVKENGKPKKKQDQAVFLTRSDVEDKLARPLGSTLTEKPPTINTITQAPDLGFVRSITSARSFNFRVLSGGTDGPYIVLSPLPLS